MNQHRGIAVSVVTVASMSLGLAASALAVTNPASGLQKLLPRAGELPGFKAAGPLGTIGSIAKDVAGDPPALRKPDAANLKRDGFVVELVQNQLGTGRVKTYGASGLTRLGSPAAAQAYDRFTFAVSARPGPVAGSAAQVRFVRFNVPRVPGAMGVAEIARHKTIAVADLQWVEGSCVIQLGDSTASSTPLTAPLIAAAQHIDNRTKGSCAP